MFYVPSNTQKTYELTLKDFKGVDFTNTKINVLPNRATAMKNMIWKDGINQKRPPYEEVLKYEKVTEVDGESTITYRRKLSGKINGCWSFTDTLKNKHTIVHCGTKLYKVIKEDETNGFDENSIRTQAIDITPSEVTINDERSSAIASDDRLYMFVGTYLVYGTWDNGNTYEIRVVADDEDTYIPITTTSITCEESQLGLRMSFEEVNMLSSKRKNKCIGMPLNNYTIQVGDILDEVKLQFYTNINFNVLTTNTTIFQCKKDYPDLNYSIYSVKYDHTTESIYYERSDSSSGYQADNAWKKDEGWINTITTFEFSGEVLINNLVGSDYLCYINQPTTYTLDTKVDNDDLNIEIDYLTLQKQNGNDVYKINKRTLYRDSNNYLRTYDSINLLDTKLGEISTTPDGFTQIKLYSNYTPLTEGEPNITVTFTKANASYIESINKCKFATMFSVEGGHYVFISGNPDKPNTDWHTEYPYNSTTATLSDFTYIPDRSYAVMGNVKDKIMGYTLVGDNTMAIHKEANGQRDTIYLRTASLSEAIEVNGTKYYKVNFHLTQGAMGEGVISSYAIDNLLNDNLFLSRNGVFGLALTQNIKSNERYALERSALVNGRLLKEPNLSEAVAISYNGKYYLAVNGNVYIADSRFKSYVSTDLPDTFSYEWWFWDELDIRIWFVIDNELYFGTHTGEICKFNWNTDYYEDITYTKIDSITLGIDNKTFTIELPEGITIQDGDLIRIRGIKEGNEVNLYYKDADEENRAIDYECEIVNYDDSSFQLKWYEYDNEVFTYEIIQDEGEHSYEGYVCYLVHKKPIESHYYTFITNLNSPLYTKRLTHISVTPEQVVNGVMTVGILTRGNRNKQVDVEGVNIFDFSNLDFTNFTFNTDDITTSFTKRLGINCNYVGFYFKSNNNRNCSLNSLSVYYQMTKLNKGVR